MTRLACILAALLWVAPQQEPEERTVAQELAALIEKTNALESFHAIYDLKRTGEGAMEMTMELVYRAPDLGRLRLSGTEGEFDNWLIGERMYFLQSEGWKSAAQPEPPLVSNVLDELFPADERPLETGVVVLLNLWRDSSAKANFRLTFVASSEATHASGAGSNIQTWNGVNLGRISELGRRAGCQVAGDGVEEIEITSKTGTFYCAAQWHADVSLDQKLVTLPPPAVAAPVDDELSRAFTRVWTSGGTTSESSISWLPEVAWNELLRSNWSAVMDALHRQKIGEAGRWLTRIERTSSNWRRRHERGLTGRFSERRAEIEKHVAEDRVKLDDVISNGETKYLDDLPQIESEKNEPRQELFDVEKEVIADLWDELLREPVLKAYDEKLAEALKR
jgi:hypothetical protein